MKKLLSVLMLTVLWASSVCTQGRTPAAVCKARASVLSLVEEGRTICTGFVVKDAANIYFESAGHCSSKSAFDSKLHIFAVDSESGTHYPLKFSHKANHWPTDDYTIFEFTGDKPATGLTTTRIVPTIGDEVYTVAGPLGLAPIMASGLYAGRARNVDEPTNEINGMYIIQIASAPGASGSPVLDDQGRVWGILVGGDSNLPGYALVVLITN